MGSGTLSPVRYPALPLAVTVEAAQEASASGWAPPTTSSHTASAIAVGPLGRPALAFLGTSPDETELRNSTVLPEVQDQGGAISLKPRAQRRYQRLGHLGSGAMGEVSLMRDNDIGRTVARKQLASRSQSPQGIAHFIEEIRTVGQLDHPNIVPIHDVGVDSEGQLFFIMKHIQGETLETILSRLAAGDPEYLKRYSTEVRIEIFVGLLRALQCAHQKNIIHRDIKPANIMIGRLGEVVLMDWGIAKVLPSPAAPSAEFAADEGALIGTPLYMSPEQIAGRVSAMDARSDIYSATVLFHELLAVRHYLAHCEDQAEVTQAILGEPFPYLRLVFVSHPRHPVPAAELLHFIAKGLAKDPADRFQSVEEMLTALQRIREGRCQVQCPATLAKRMVGGLGHFIDHYPKLSPFVVFSLLLLLASCLVLTGRLLG